MAQRMRVSTILAAALLVTVFAEASTAVPSGVLVLGSSDPYHSPMVEAARPILEDISRRAGIPVELTRRATDLSDENLSRFQAVVQLHFAPFELSTEEQQSLQRFVLRGGGWVGVHAAGLTGRQFLSVDAHYWEWFETFFGGVLYSPHPALQRGTVVIEDRTHPVTQHLPERFQLLDEWYEFDHSPRPNVHVLGRADETTYRPAKPMGDHPILWTNPHFRRMVYIGIGHDVSVCTDPNFTTLLRDAILWARTPEEVVPHAPERR